MKKIIFCLLISLLSIHAPAQNSLPKLNSDSISKTLSQMDSVIKKRMAGNQQIDTEQNNRNLDALMTEIRKRDKKEKQQMYIRLALGVFFFIVLVIGLMRRRKKKTV